VAHRAFRTSIDITISALLSEATDREIAFMIRNHLEHSAYVRGITPEWIYSLPKDFFRNDITMFLTGHQNDDQGYDADGSPVMEYPGHTIPWSKDFTPTPDKPFPEPT
jgi:hypothetical protein